MIQSNIESFVINQKSVLRVFVRCSQQFVSRDDLIVYFACTSPQTLHAWIDSRGENDCHYVIFLLDLSLYGFKVCV